MPGLQFHEGKIQLIFPIIESGGVLEAGQDLPVEHFVAELQVEALTVVILPRRPANVAKADE